MIKNPSKLKAIAHESGLQLSIGAALAHCEQASVCHHGALLQGWALLVDELEVRANGADLRGIHPPVGGFSMISCDLRHARFDHADLCSSDFTDSDLTAASFRSADLRNADFTGALLDDADFTDADLAGARGLLTWEITESGKARWKGVS